MAFTRYGTASFGFRLLHSASAISRLRDRANQLHWPAHYYKVAERTFVVILQTLYRLRDQDPFPLQISANAFRNRG